MNKQSYWQIAIDDIAFNNVKQGLCEGCQVAVDTGTSLLAGPSDVIQRLGDKLNVKEDCSNFSSLPYLGFTVGDHVLNLKPDDYIDKSEDGCSVSLMTLDVPPPNGPLFVFGDPFLRRFLTVYDRSGPSVGFAVAKQTGLTKEDVDRLLATVGTDHSSTTEDTTASSASADFTASSSAAPVDTGESLESALDSEGGLYSQRLDSSAPPPISDDSHMKALDAFMKNWSGGAGGSSRAAGALIQAHEEAQLVSVQLHRSSHKDPKKKESNFLH